MAGPLSGIVVIEAANWLAAPSAGALMADLGADVVKVEPPGGDPFRFYDQRASGYDHDFALNYAFELDNRGKAIDHRRSREGGRSRPGAAALRARGRVPDQPHAASARALRAHGRGAARRCARPSSTPPSPATERGAPDSERAGFDYSAFWARSGVMAALQQPPGARPAAQPAGPGRSHDKPQPACRRPRRPPASRSERRGAVRGSHPAGLRHVEHRYGPLRGARRRPGCPTA